MEGDESMRGDLNSFPSKVHSTSRFRGSSDPSALPLRRASARKVLHSPPVSARVGKIPAASAAVPQNNARTVVHRSCFMISPHTGDPLEAKRQEHCTEEKCRDRAQGRLARGGAAASGDGLEKEVQELQRRPRELDPE